MSSYEKAKGLMSTGPARPTLYTLRINNVSFNENNYLEMFCRNVIIPGVSHSVLTTLGQEQLGVRNQIPEAVVFASPLRLEVIEDAEFSMYKAMRRMFDTTAVNANPLSGGSNQKTQRMNYYDDFTFGIDLYKLAYPSGGGRFFRPQVRTNSGISAPYEVVQEYHFDKCYLTSIEGITLASDAYDQLLSFAVAFNYETYSTK